MGWEEFKNEVFTAAKNSFIKVQQVNEDEDFYAFSLYIDSDAISIGCSSNSIQALKRKLSQEEYEAASAQDFSYIKWASSEWEYEAFDAENFRAACEFLRTSAERRDIKAFKEKVISSLVDVLSKLKNDKVFNFKSSVNKGVFFVTITDDDGAEAVENATALKLNDGALLSEFINRYEV